MPMSLPAVEYIFERLQNELPAILTYHNFEHTRLVYDSALEIGAALNLSSDDMDMMAVASAFHDAGFLLNMDEHEKHGCQLAEEVLPNFDYSKSDIEKIQSAIMATKIPQSPKDLFEQVLCDADMFYLAGDNHPVWRRRLKNELLERGILKQAAEFEKLELSFMYAHEFHTQYATERARANKQAIIEELTAG
jgi:uncharacterized protein